MAAPLQDFGRVMRALFRFARYLAKARCRAFSSWNEAGRLEATRGAFKEAGAFSKDIVTEILKTVGGGLWKIPASAIGKLVDAVGGLFKKTPDDGAEPEPAGA